MIKTHTYINCYDCQEPIPVGEDAFYINDTYLCEACADKALEQIKEDARTEVNDSNFELEEEITL